MRCVNCRSEMRSEHRDYDYSELGPAVVLQNLEVGVCDECGDWGPIIPCISGLHETIARLFVRKPGPLTGSDVRFLRDYLYWSGRELADKLNTRPETVSRWERGHQPIGPNSDALLRWLVVSEAGIEGFDAHDAIRLRKAQPDPNPIRLRYDGEQWQTVPPKSKPEAIAG